MRPAKPPPQPTGPPEWKVKLETKRRARRKFWARFVAILLVVGIAGFGYWILSLPSAPAAEAPPPISQAEAQSIVAALAPTRRAARPIVAIIGINEGTETTDYLMPYGILKRADVADVFALATQSGPIDMFPAFKLEPTATIADFDAKHPSGADYVIVPQMSRADDPDALSWIRSQAEKGAIVIGVCAGATIVANTGLLDDKRGTTHWYYLKGMLAKHPSIRYVRDRRFVVDGDVATTTGITASMPMSLTLIEAIAGRDKAVSVAADLGLTHWDASHSSSSFAFTRPFALTAMRNTLAFWKHEKLGLKLELGADEVSLALVADAWSRTYRSRAVTFAADVNAGITRNGLKIIPDEIRASWDEGTQLEPLWERPPARALDGALAAIATRYGASTRNLVAMQLEYR
jgi:putative intracellular protease/amidase